MNAVHIVGKKNHGKTTLVAAIVEDLAQRGLRVGTLKHCHRDHELDTPGKDSHIHRKAGACTVAAVTPGLTAVFQKRPETADTYEELRAAYDGCDIVIIEGDVSGPGPKMEVWRAERGTRPLASERADIAAVITDDAAALVEICTPRTILSRQDVPAIAERALELAEEL